MYTLPTTILGLVILILLSRFYIFPLLVSHLSGFQINRLSFLSLRGLEYRIGDDTHSVIPTLRVEKAAWAWGGWKEDGVKGLIVLRLDGVSFRVKKRPKTDKPKPVETRPKVPPGRVVYWRNRSLSYLLQVLIHHWPSLARIVSVQVGDIRLIFDDLDGIELTVRDVHMGVKVIFEGAAEPAEVSMSSPVMASSNDSGRAYPLASPTPEATSPFLSPPGFFHSFSFPLPVDSSTRPSRIEAARRRASRMSSTANTIWSRAIARARGQVIFMTNITDISLILPHHTEDSKRHTTHPHLLAHRASNRSMASDAGKERTRSFVNPVRSLLSPQPPRYALPSEGGYERLLVVDDVSAAQLALGFGPKKGLLGEDTLRTTLAWGRIQTSLEATDRIREIIKHHGAADQKKDTPAQWSPHGMPRIILRAFESVSLSFAHFTLSHYLPASEHTAHSAASSATDISDLLIVDDDVFTISLEVDQLYCQLDAADSSTNQRTRNAFGTNSNPESKVRGIGVKLAWTSIGVQCIAPGEDVLQKSQLFEMRSAEFEGCSTWRPGGWSREELLFANDPNLALIVGRGGIQSVDVAADLPLLYDLKQAWQRSRPDTPKVDAKPSSPGLPPRVRMVLDVGHVMILVVDPSSDKNTTLTMASDGLHIGCFTSFSDIVARRNRTATKAAFKAEEELRTRREQSTDEDYSQPTPMLKPQYRRHFTQTPAKLRDDYAMAMRADASLEMEPLSLHMTLSGDCTDSQTHHLASIGRLHTTLGGDIWGKQEVLADGTEQSRLVPDSRSFAFDLGIDQGVKVDLWEPAVVDALATLASVHRPPSQPTTTTPVLDKLPTGLSIRLSLGLISIFVGHPDPNPECKLKLIRGIWLQTQATLEYSYYGNSVQAMTCRHPLTSASRSRLRLPEDIKTQALAHYNELAPDGRAALFAGSLADTFVKPIFHGERFVQAGGTYLSHEVPQSPKQRQGDDFVGWEFLRPPVEADLSKGKFANNLAPLEDSETEQAARPLIRMPQCTLVFVVRSEDPSAEVGYNLRGDVDGIDVVADLSHIYCALLASLVVRRLASAAKHPSPKPSKPKSPSQLHINVSINHVNMHLVYPAGEHMVLYVKVIKVNKRAGEAVHTRVEYILMYVPSPRELGAFEELARLRGLDLSCDTTGRLTVKVEAEALRLRIPFGYIFAKLVLNIQLAVKSIKLLTLDLGSDAEFLFIRRPEAEEPKVIPTIALNIRHISLEAKDNPIETRLNLIWRVGINEQKGRNEWEDTFERKQQTLEEPSIISLDEELTPGRRGTYKLSKNATVTYEEARYRLDWFKAQEWRKRIDKAIKTQRQREHDALKNMENVGPDRKLPIRIAAATQSAPLFRAAFENVGMTIKALDWSREGLVKYMGEVSAPFDEGTEFSLFVPIHLTWTMNSGSFKLRDYPLDLVKIPTGDDGQPSWHLETPFIIAEELQGDDSVVYIPSQVIPRHLGAKDAAAFVVQISKTIMPVKTYARPVITISSSRVTEFTWGNSYSPAISDLMRVVDTLSHPPRDPSPRVGFWDKFRLILHWRVTMNFTGPVHLHLKGATDPYATTGFGAGFALAWSGGTRVEINQPNEQYETIQIIADELLIAIPDLTGVHDGEAIGREAAGRPRERAHQDLIERRYTKPCAQYQNGVRVGFGFVFERTCRPWNCKHDCGSTENLLHRQCRIMESKKHQQVILRSPEAVARDDKEAGRPTDSYEGFRSDWIHFSVSNVSPLNKVDPEEKDSNKLTGLFFSPKAFAHFFAWWKLFDSATSLPIRQGKLFPDSPPTSKKFGRSLATIKYRFDLAPVYVSHVYMQVAPELWAKGKGQALGVKARFGSFRADAHQRAQEKVVRHEKLHRTTIVTHKPFYAADLLLENIEVKGVKAEFHESTESGRATPTSDNLDQCRACELKPDRKVWFNFFDYIDADRKPLDRDPEVEIVDIGDCPQVFFSKRVKARQTTPCDDTQSLGSSQDSRLELESTKFGHERSHVCYLGEASPVAPTQMRITRDRIKELMEMRGALSDDDPTYTSDLRNINGRLNSLNKHVEDLSNKESRHIDDDTFQAAYVHPLDQEGRHSGDVSFESTFHVHCPRIIMTNAARNLLYKYYFSSRDRKREEYFTSHASLRGVREGMTKRMEQRSKGFFEDHVDQSAAPEQDDGLDILQELQEMLVGPKAARRFEVRDHSLTGEEELRRRSIGIPEVCIVKPQHNFLILKPQIALRSNIDADAIVLLAIEEVSFKGYRVMDQNFSDPVAANVLDRNYIAMKGLQAFYPSESTMGRERGPLGVPRGLDFLPLEILLDVRSEATDYDRIVLKTDAAFYYDRFNHLRVPRGLEWPKAQDDEGYSMDHLRRHQDLVTIIVPRLSLAATSKHYTALYNVVTDLLLYTDPEHRERSERIDSFIYAFDRKDRDPHRLILELFVLQQDIRQLAILEKGYAQNLDLLDETGKAELFRIRTDHLDGMEQLFTVFEAIAVNQARDDAKAALKTASRMDARVGGIAWHMLRDDLTPLVKLDMEGTLYSMVSNKDGSTDNAAVFGEISMLNSDTDALYPEVLARYDMSTSRRGQRDSFASIFMATMAPVGGIHIVRHLAVHLHPVRFKLEERLGHEIVDYVFNDRVKRRRQKAEENGNGHKNGTSTPSDSTRHLHMPGRQATRSASGLEMLPLQRSKSQASVLSEVTGRTSEDTEGDTKFTIVPIKDAAEMRRRASANKTFVRIVFADTSIILSFKTDETKKHRTFSIPDCVDFKFKTPEIVYTNKVWSYEDLFEHVKRDTRSYAWSQTGDLLSQLFKKTSVFRSKKTLKQIATLSPSDAPRLDTKSRIPSISSKLRYTVEPPTPKEEVQKTLALARALSREILDPANPLSRPLSNGEGTSHVLGVPLNMSPPGDTSDEENDSDREDHGVVGRTVKGILGKLRSRTSLGHNRRNSGSFGSSEELSRIASSERVRRHSPSISSSSSSHHHHHVV